MFWLNILALFSFITVAIGVYNTNDIREIVSLNEDGAVLPSTKIFPPCEARDMTECLATERSFKMVEFLKTSVVLNDRIGTILDSPSWMTDQELEGNSRDSFHKSKILQDMADDDRVETICEIGTNAGYSAINFLIANSQAKLISFDLSAHAYTGAAIRVIQELYPDRITAFISGNSSISVPSAAALLSQNKCNVIFIDGGHATWDLRADIDNMRAYANESFNILVIDDLDMPLLRNVWTSTPMMKVLDDIYCSEFRYIGYSFNETSFSYDFDLKEYFYSGIIGVGQYLF